MDESWERYLAKPGRKLNDDASAHDERRLAVFESMFGSSPFVRTLPVPTPPGPLDVYVYDAPAPEGLPLILVPGPLTGSPPGRRRRSFTTLVTSGASNQSMAYPEETPPEFRRVELGMYLDDEAVKHEPDLIDFCCDLLMHHAKKPFLDESFLAVGMVVPVCAIGQGQVAFLGDPSISALVVSPPPAVLPESDLRNKLVLDGEGVNFFCLVPITAAQERMPRSDSFEDFAIRTELSVVYRGRAGDAAPSGLARSSGRLNKQIRIAPKQPELVPLATPVRIPSAVLDALRPEAEAPPASIAKPDRKTSKKRPKARDRSPVEPKQSAPKKPWWKLWG